MVLIVETTIDGGLYINAEAFDLDSGTSLVVMQPVKKSLGDGRLAVRPKPLDLQNHCRWSLPDPHFIMTSNPYQLRSDADYSAS